MKITKSQLKKIVSEELNMLLKEVRKSDGKNRFLSRSSRNMAMMRGDVDIPDDMRPKTSKKTAKKKSTVDYKQSIGPAGMSLKFEEESANESKNIIAAFQKLLAEEDVQAEILKVLEDKLKDVDLASLFSSEGSDLSALTEKRRK